MTRDSVTDESGVSQESLSGEIREQFEQKEPSEERKNELRSKHDGHLVRDTTSKLSVDAAEDIDGVEVDAKVEIPDLYCFSCGEWIGLSGVDLRGTPRSKKEAHYLGGMPSDVRSAKNGTQETLTELADALTERVGHIEDRADAFMFIETELEKLRKVEDGE